jgi:hypothetical protein
LKNVHKNLPQQAEKLPKCCAEEQKPGAFQRICPIFEKLFLKNDFFDSFNGRFYRARARPFSFIFLPSLDAAFNGWAALFYSAKSDEKCTAFRESKSVRKTSVPNWINSLGTLTSLSELKAWSNSSRERTRRPFVQD